VRIARFAAGDEVSYGLVGTARAGSVTGSGEIIAELAGHPFGGGSDGVRLTGTTYPLTDVRLLAPVLPSKVIGFGPSGPGLAGRAADGLDDGSVMYLKPSTAVCGPSDAIRYPAQVSRLRADAKLAVIIGRLCRQVPPDQAAAVIFGYACALDVTAADLQASDGQWARAKGFDTFCPLGPWLETDPLAGDVMLVTSVNGQVRGRTSIPRAGQGVAALIAATSSVMTLLPGDVLLAGGAGGAAGELACGDEVSVSTDAVGTLTNKVDKGD
jgi:2-keto-4-pentenoate hydratase/2-oxohepta-3-ene-1,7-dioic acid hydratase in catechol pathway